MLNLGLFDVWSKGVNVYKYPQLADHVILFMERSFFLKKINPSSVCTIWIMKDWISFNQNRVDGNQR